MTEGRFEACFRGLCRHPLAIGAGLALIAALAALGLGFARFDGGLEIMLPEGSTARRTVRFLHEADFADKVAISVAAPEGSEGTAALTARMEELAAELRASPMVRRVVSFPGGEAMMGELTFILDHAPQLIGSLDAEELRERISPEEVRRRVRECYVRLLRPEGSFVQEVLRRDPLGLSAGLLERLSRLPEAFGYRLTAEHGHLVHPDGRHGLLLTETNVPVTDGLGARRLVDMLRDACAGLPAGYTAQIVCGHLHTVSNERLLRSDILLTLSAASIGFLVLFLGIFRDVRAAIIFLIPAIAILVSMSVTRLIIGQLSYLIAGFAAVMAGIAVDYGIHVYVAVRRRPDPYRAVRGIIKPVTMGGLTTLCVFVAFFLSAIPGYRQLAILAIISIVLSIISAVVLLPSLVRRAGPANGAVGTSAPKGSRRWALVFLASLVAAAAFTPWLRVDTGLANLDGTEPEVLEAEERFRELWGGGSAARAIAVAEGESYGEAARRSDALHGRLADALDGESVISLASIWPSGATRAQNLARWRGFWTAERRRLVRERVTEAASEYGFSDDAFAPFFRILEADLPVRDRPEGSAVFAQIEDRFVKQHEGGYWFMSFFPDAPTPVEAATAAAAGVPGAFIVSRQALAATLARSVGDEVVRISGTALVLILLVTFTLMRSLRMAAAALVPAATGALWLFAAMVWTGLAINIANMMAGIVVVGLCIDYGIFMAHGWAQGRSVLAPTRQAVTLSAATTLMGAGVLIFASHPALFAIGLTLVVGVFSGYLAAILAVPGVCSLLKVPAGEGVTP